MTQTEQQTASVAGDLSEFLQKTRAKKFSEEWKDRGDEKQETQRFWIGLLGEVLGVPQSIISPKNGQKIPKITNLQYNKGRANYGTKKKSIYG